MTSDSSDIESTRLSAARARDALAGFRRWQRRQVWIALSIAAAGVIGAALLFAFLGGRLQPHRATLSFFAVVIALSVVFGIGVSWLQLLGRRRVARALLRANGSLCPACRAVLPTERPLPKSVTRACCIEASELLSHDELQRWWEQWLAAPAIRWASVSSRAGGSRLLPAGSPRRRIAVMAAWTIGVFTVVPVLFAVPKSLGAGGSWSFEYLFVEILSALPSYLAMAIGLIGINLITIGLGWSVERGPFCAKCGYRWREGASGNCPECGADWNAAAGRKLHRSRRSNPVLVAGALLTVLGGFAVFGSIMPTRGALVPTNMLLANGDFRTSYCPRVEALMKRTLTRAERRALALLTIEALEALLDDLAAGAKSEELNINFSASQWLAAEIGGAHGPTDADLQSRARSLLAPLNASIVDGALRLEGRSKYTMLNPGAGSSLTIAIEEPQIEPLVDAIGDRQIEGLADPLDGTEHAEQPSRRWGAAIDSSERPGTIVRSGEAFTFAVGSDWEWRRTDVPIALPAKPGRYLVRVRHWVILDPTRGSRPLLDAEGRVAVPPGGWVERYEQRLIIEVP